MKVKVIETESLAAGELHLYCQTHDAQVEKIQRYAEGIGTTIHGKNRNEFVLIQPEQIYYIESVDRKTFVYTEKESFECSLKLYEAETVLEAHTFIRATKSSMINIQKIKKVVPQLNRNLLITLNNNEKVEMSRRYVKAFREKLGME